MAEVIIKPDYELLLFAFAALRTTDVGVNAVIHQSGFAENAPYEGDLFFSRR